MGVVNTDTSLNYPTEVSKAVYLLFCVINRCGDKWPFKETCGKMSLSWQYRALFLCHVVLFASSEKQEYNVVGKGKMTGKRKVWKEKKKKVIFYRRCKRKACETYEGNSVNKQVCFLQIWVPPSKNTSC